MTCMKQEFCIHEKYCQRHIGQNFDSCILFSRNSKPMTNEEWLRSATTEQLAEFIDGIARDGGDLIKRSNKSLIVYKHNFWEEWLKQPHKE